METKDGMFRMAMTPREFVWLRPPPNALDRSGERLFVASLGSQRRSV